MSNVAQAFSRAVQYHQAGNLNLAEPLYRQVLQADPNHGDAHHLF
jgi:Tfp pilus assembly protein PilF